MNDPNKLACFVCGKRATEHFEVSLFGTGYVPVLICPDCLLDYNKNGDSGLLNFMRHQRRYLRLAQ